MPEAEPLTRAQLVAWVLFRSREAINRVRQLEQTGSDDPLYLLVIGDALLKPALKSGRALGRAAIDKAEKQIAAKIESGTLTVREDGTFARRQVVSKRNWPAKNGRGVGKLPARHFDSLMITRLALWIRAHPKKESLDRHRLEFFGDDSPDAVDHFRNEFPALIAAALPVATRQIGQDLRLRSLRLAEGQNLGSLVDFTKEKAAKQKKNVRTWTQRKTSKRLRRRS